MEGFCFKNLGDFSQQGKNIILCEVGLMLRKILVWVVGPLVFLDGSEILHSLI